MNLKGKAFVLMIITTILLMISGGTSTQAYVGSVFTYTYAGQTLTYRVLSEPTVSDNGRAKLIYDKENNQALTGELIIPATVTNYNMPYDVVQIENIAFMDAKEITEVTLPETITEIGEAAFRNCINLRRINIPSKVKRIEDSTFYGCRSLESINLPKGVTYIGNNAFAECSSLMSVGIQEGLTYIGSNAFANCAHLTGINLPKGLSFLGDAVFSGCSSLTKIKIPESIKNLGDSMFQDCVSLTTVDLPEGLLSIGKNAFSNCILLSDIHLADTIQTIGAYAFYLCQSLTEIKIPYEVTRIEGFTFFGASSLKKITIQDKVTSIGDYVFSNNSSLISINLPEGLTHIGNWTFYGCSNLRPIQIPRTVISIGSGEFPYTGVFVYHNSYAEEFFQKNHPQYYQVLSIPLKGMYFTEEVKNIKVNDAVTLTPVYYPEYSSEISDTIKWISEDPSIVSVDSKGGIKGLLPGETDIIAEMGSFQARSHIIVDGSVINPTAIEVDSFLVELNKGDTKKLSLTYTPFNTTNRNVTWTSSDPSVVTVENGLIYGKKPGIAFITATSSTLSAQSKVTVVNPLKEIYSDYSKITLEKGETRSIAVTLKPMDTTDNQSVMWRSDDESVATVKNGVITAVNSGETTITAYVGSLTHSIPVEVQIPIKSLTITQDKMKLKAGQSQALPLVVLPMEASQNIRVTSSDDTIVTYLDGMITGKKRGKATITVKGGSFTVSTVVTVETDIQSIKLNQTGLTLNIGQSDTLKVEFNPVSPADDRTIIWKTDDSSVATVDSKGKVKALGPGTAKITATAEGIQTIESIITVKLGKPSSFKAVSAGYQSIKLSWGTTSGAAGYRVYRADTPSGSFKMIKETTSRSFTDKALTTGKTYYYKVRGYTYQGSKKVYSSYTSVIKAKPVPATPENIKLVKQSSSKNNFTWSKVSGASGYEIYRASSKNGTFQKVKTTTSLHFINYGLTKGRTYYYKIRTYRIVGKQKVYSSFSEVYSIKM